MLIFFSFLSLIDWIAVNNMACASTNIVLSAHLLPHYIQPHTPVNTQATNSYQNSFCSFSFSKEEIYFKLLLIWLRSALERNIVGMLQHIIILASCSNLLNTTWQYMYVCTRGWLPKCQHLNTFQCIWLDKQITCKKHLLQRSISFCHIVWYFSRFFQHIDMSKVFVHVCNFKMTWHLVSPNKRSDRSFHKFSPTLYNSYAHTMKSIW